MRPGSLVGGFVAAWIGYIVRPRCCPTAPASAAVAVGLVVAVRGDRRREVGRLALWSTLLGTAGFTGAYEFTFAAAPLEVAPTSSRVATTLLFNVAVGFLAAALMPRPVSPERGRPPPSGPRRR